MDFKSLIPFGRSSALGAVGETGTRDPFLSFRREMDRLFDDFSRDWPQPTLWGQTYAAGSGFLTPKVDVAETEAGLELTADLPGLEAKDIDLEVANGLLTLKATRASGREEKDDKKHYHLVERASGVYLRRFALPFEVETDKIEATFDKGILRVTVPRAKVAEPERTRISIKAA